MNNKDPISNPLVYIPPNARINIKDDKSPPPTVKYEKRRVVFPRDQIREKVTKRETP